jgi:hypothetical protein
VAAAMSRGYFDELSTLDRRANDIGEAVFTSAG